MEGRWGAAGRDEGFLSGSAVRIPEAGGGLHCLNSFVFEMFCIQESLFQTEFFETAGYHYY